MRWILSLAAAMMVCFSPAGAAGAEKKETVRLVYVEWPCAVVTSNIAKVALEERTGTRVELLSVSVPVMFQALASKEADATVAAWLPDTHATYMESLEGRIVDLGPIVSGARLGWVVPDYVPLTSIEEMRGKAREFKGRVYGIDPGAIYMQNAEEAIKGYGLEGFELMTGSDAVMVASLADAIRKKEWIVVTGWAPHWKFGRWDLHFLEDPKGYFGKEEAIHAVSRNGLDADMPRVHAFLKNFFYTDTQQLQTLMAQAQEKGADPLEIARRFVREHPEQVEAWFAPAP